MKINFEHELSNQIYLIRDGKILSVKIANVIITKNILKEIKVLYYISKEIGSFDSKELFHSKKELLINMKRNYLESLPEHLRSRSEKINLKELVELDKEKKELDYDLEHTHLSYIEFNYDIGERVYLMKDNVVKRYKIVSLFFKGDLSQEVDVKRQYKLLEETKEKYNEKELIEKAESLGEDDFIIIGEDKLYSSIDELLIKL